MSESYYKPCRELDICNELIEKYFNTQQYPVWKAVPAKQFVIPTVLFPVSVSATKNMTGGGASVQAVVFWWVVTTMNTASARSAPCAVSRY